MRNAQDWLVCGIIMVLLASICFEIHLNFVGGFLTVSGILICLTCDIIHALKKTD